MWWDRPAGLTEDETRHTCSRLMEPARLQDAFGMGLASLASAGGTPLTYHTDGLGSVRALSDAAENAVQSYQTDEFGVPTERSGPRGQPFGYTGEVWDLETGLLNLRARLYDPAIGRFLQRDSFAGSPGAPQSLNRCSYALNNPVNMVDPSGHVAWFLVLGVAWAAFEIGSQVVDAVELVDTWSSPNSSWKDRISTGGLFAVGMAAPGGGYATGAKALKSLPFRPILTQGNRRMGLEHIVRRHWHSSGVVGTSKFAQDIGARELRDIIHEAAASGNAWRVEGSSRVLDADIVGRVIGTDPAGQPTSRIRVVVTEAGEVVTAYPIPSSR